MHPGVHAKEAMATEHLRFSKATEAVPANCQEMCGQDYY